MNKSYRFSILTLCAVITLCACNTTSCNKGDSPTPETDNGSETEQISDVISYVTTKNQSKLFTLDSLSFNKGVNISPYTIHIDKNTKYQQMDGFGAAITGSTCYNLLKMTQSDRTSLLKEVFDPDEGMGFSYIRVSIGCSDFSMDEYTCCDTKGIENFEMNMYDKRDLFPILKEILAINPNIKIMGSPWTCPRWMKVNNLTDLDPYNSWTSGQLNPAYYDDYATYFVKWINAMEDEGFPIESITIQNEPLNRGNSVSLYMSWEEQSNFVRNNLGPAFKANNIDTKIIIYDHNFDENNYPINIYNDPDANKYVYGSAWHAYAGSPSALDAVHQAYPDKKIYFTEQSIGEWISESKSECFSKDLMWSMENCFIGTINRYCSGVIMWNLLLDSERGPNRPGGCNTCYGCIDISKSDYKTLTKNSHFYNISHFSKVVKPGAYRIKSSGFNLSGLEYSVFLNPDGSYAAVVMNNSDSQVNVTFEDDINSFSDKLLPTSVTSYTWKN